MPRALAVPFCLLAMLVSVCPAAARDLEPTPPDDVIRDKGKGTDILWTLPLGPAIVDDMRLLAPGRLLVSLREDGGRLPNLDLMLVETATGKVLWRFDRSGRKGTFRPILFTEESIAYVVEETPGGTLLVLDARSGSARWSATLSGPDPFATPSPDGADVLVAERKAKEAVLSLRNGATGAARWSLAARGPGAAGMVQDPVFRPEGLWHYFDGVTRLDPVTGKTLWARTDLYVSRFDPPPQVEGPEMLLVSGKDLYSLDAESGKTVWRIALPSMNVSNIYALGERVYLRGSPGKEPGNLLASLRRRDGGILWTVSRPEPMVSNLLLYGDRILFASGTSVAAVSEATGKELFRTTITNTGKTFPVRLRPYADRVIFIGELALAAVDPGTGKRLWFRGATPVSNEASLSSLDGSIPRLKREQTDLAGGEVDYGSSFAFQLLKQYQNDTARYRDEYVRASGRGDYWGREKASLQGRISSSFEAMQSTIALCLSAVEMAQKLKLFLDARDMEEMRARQELLRRSILTGYRGAEGEGWILRPDRKWKSVTDDFIGVTLIRLPDGKDRFIPLSPAYLSYGLWNVFDAGQDILVHHGIGLDPKAYRYGASRSVPPYGKIRTIGTSLTAVRAGPAR